MKEAMRQIDQDGSYRFSDASIGQTATFRFDDPTQFSPKLYEQFQGQKVPYEVLRDYALNETPFGNPKSMLRALERQGVVASVDYNGRRRRGDFAEDKTNSVTFSLPGTDVQHGFQF